jgi:hypothetical protein
MGASVIGGMLGQSAANKGPQPINPGTNAAYLQNINSLAGAPGVPGGAPATGATATMQNMIATGNPTNVGPAFQAFYNQQQRGVTQGRDALLSSFGGAGARYSSAAMTAVGDYENQANMNFLQVLSQYTMQAQEAAAARQLQASEFALSGQQEAGLAYKGPKGSVVGTGLQGAGAGLETIGMLSSMGMLKGSSKGGNV